MGEFIGYSARDLDLRRREAAAKQVWIEHAVDGGYKERSTVRGIHRAYEQSIKMLTGMVNSAADCALPHRPVARR